MIWKSAEELENVIKNSEISINLNGMKKLRKNKFKTSKQNIE